MPPAPPANPSRYLAANLQTWVQDKGTQPKQIGDKASRIWDRGQLWELSGVHSEDFPWGTGSANGLRVYFTGILLHGAGKPVCFFLVFGTIFNHTYNCHRKCPALGFLACFWP